MRFWLQAISAAVIACASSSVHAADEGRFPGPIGQPEGAERAQLHWVRVYVNDQPIPDVIQMRICRPRTDNPVGVAIVNHGSPEKSSDRPKMTAISCNTGVARYFMGKDMAVAFPLRRGYGASGGNWAETYGSCSNPDYVRAGLASAADIDSVVRYLRSFPYIRGDKIMVVGQSAGGWATVAYASLNPQNILALIDVAGGRGGHNDGLPNNNCRPERLIEAAGVYGKTARQPMLWMFTENDTFFRPELSGAMHAAFAKSGGQATYKLLPAWGNEGHNLFFGNNGSQVWAPVFDAYLKDVLPAAGK